MPASVLIDTGFLIALANPADPQHESAREYWKYFKTEEMLIYLSAIVVSEFEIVQKIPDDILKACVMLPFNYADGVRAAQYDWTRDKPEGVQRDAMKDDIKIIAQAAGAGVDYVITRDPNSFVKYCEALRAKGHTKFRIINLAEGFDKSHFEGGQTSMFNVGGE